MPDVEPRTLPSREGLTNQQDQADLQAVCSGRRQACALLNSPSPCVNSAFCHIQDMRSLIENWFQKPRKYQPEIDPDKPTLRFQLRDLDSDSTDLHVKGIAISAREGYQRLPLEKKINDVLSDVVDLVERLEADRQFAEEALQKEKRIRETLESKVDSISLWKLIEHPSIVQKEHDACSRDIAELKWQLKLEKQKVDQVQEKLLQAEVLNRKLQEDVDFARNQIPIVRENLDHQKEILYQIDTAQAEADDMYSKTESHLLQAQIELKKMEAEAKKERTSLALKQLEIECQLAETLQDFNLLELAEKGLLVEIKETEEAIIRTENKCTHIIQRMPEIAEFDRIEKDMIFKLNLEIENNMQKCRKLKEKLTSEQEEIDRKKPMWEAEVSFTEAQFQSKHEAFAALCKENQEFEQKVEDYKMKICESEKAVKWMREERKQMLQKITDNDEQWEKAKEEVTQVVDQHSVIQAKLEEQEKLNFMEEQTATTNIDHLKKDLITNMTALEVLKAQSANVNVELKKQQRSSELTNRQLQKEFDESSSATQVLEAKFKRMKELTENLENMLCEQKKTLVSLKKENNLKWDQLKAAQDLHCSTLQRTDNALARTTLLKNESEEYQKASDEIEKNVEIVLEVIAEFEKDFHVLEFKNKSAALIMSTLQSDIHNWQQRTQQFMRTRMTHLKARKELMEEIKEALKAAHIENKQLASNYEVLKKTLLEAKQESVSALNDKNQAHNTYSYYTELSLLQKRMHKVWVKYLEQRNLRSLAELDWCQALFQQIAQEIKTAQGKLLEEIQLISAFLQSQRDHSTTTKNAGKNKQTSPDAVRVNE
ncbi:coiled-coil domain-containing protein 178 isoform X1 [Girardinichthys multiradiatus]|uniref:coiled-coil domain-containing protein 178 isoform X1 n=1 Tax=Girardinichthys multiradiatus TaxID=208333 RepID=UPI001FAD2665|nr:coiled-coil domain-containing protein 178 isoform X1 [Girardinichthys multiradiatus]